MMSDDTNGSSDAARMPFSSPSAAVRKAVASSSTVVSRDALNVRSTTDASGTGTRIAAPSSLPLSCG